MPALSYLHAVGNTGLNVRKVTIMYYRTLNSIIVESLTTGKFIDALIQEYRYVTTTVVDGLVAYEYGMTTEELQRITRSWHTLHPYSRVAERHGFRASVMGQVLYLSAAARYPYRRYLNEILTSPLWRFCYQKPVEGFENK